MKISNIGGSLRSARGGLRTAPGSIQACWLGVVPRAIRSCRIGSLILLLVVLTGWLSFASAQAGILEQCRTLTDVEDEIHICLDNFLDAMDDNMADLEAFITSELAADESGNPAVIAFQSAQTAFVEYRRQNCLWYLDFSATRSEGEQIAKNCLARMSRERLIELQALINSSQSGAQDVSGYYVYGANRNSFQLCGSPDRYWIEGDNKVVSQLQQDYLRKATAELQILYITVTGEIDTAADTAYPEHEGVFVLQQIRTIRTPTDNDCQLPSTPVTASLDPDVGPVTESLEAPVAKVDTASPSDDVSQIPEQTLTAYFGDWVARCEQLGTAYGCQLTVAMQGDRNSESGMPATLIITRRSGQRTVVDFDIAVSETHPLVDDVDQITWNIDKVPLGTIQHSKLQNIKGTGDQAGTMFTRQSLRERWYIRDELMPLMQRGVRLSVLINSRTSSDITLSATLKGLSRALAFADDFTLSEGEI